MVGFESVQSNNRQFSIIPFRYAHKDLKAYMYPNLNVLCQNCPLTVTEDDRFMVSFPVRARKTTKPYLALSLIIRHLIRRQISLFSSVGHVSDTCRRKQVSSSS
jgi:hypothetical protein